MYFVSSTDSSPYLSRFLGLLLFLYILTSRQFIATFFFVVFPISAVSQHTNNKCGTHHPIVFPCPSHLFISFCSTTAKSSTLSSLFIFYFFFYLLQRPFCSDDVFHSFSSFSPPLSSPPQSCLSSWPFIYFLPAFHSPPSCMQSWNFKTIYGG